MRTWTYQCGLLCLLSYLSSTCQAFPVSRLGRHLPRQVDNPRGSNLDPGIWIPVAATLGAFILMLVLRVFYKRYKQRRAIAEARARGEPILLTANQLAGENAPTATEARRRGRRGRRPRRTPSQISTKSLPAYMEVPGEAEVVLVRRREDMVPEENEDERPGHSRNTSESTMQSDDEDEDYEPNERPLLPPDEGSRSSMDIVSSRPESSMMRPSYDSERGLLHDHNHEHEDDAPAYLEVLEGAPSPVAPAGPSANTSTPSASHTPNNTVSPMRATLMKFFSPWSSHPPPATPEMVSTPTIPPIITSPPANVQSSPSSHDQSRPSLSPSTPPSIMTSSGHRSSTSLSTTPSRISSNNASTSNTPNGDTGVGRSSTKPRRSSSAAISALLSRSAFGHRPPPATSSTISQISAPVPTSVTRTDFQYPPAGLTPEQMAFVSSTQSLIRFGVPYGEAAAEAPPDYTGNTGAGAARRTSLVNGPRARSSVDLRSSHTRAARGGSASTSNLTLEVPTPHHTPSSSSHDGHITEPSSTLNPVEEMPSPSATDGQTARIPTPPPFQPFSLSTSAVTLPEDGFQTSAPKSTLGVPHRRESSSTMNSFATAPEASHPEDEETEGELTETEDSARERAANRHPASSSHSDLPQPSQGWSIPPPPPVIAT